MQVNGGPRFTSVPLIMDNYGTHKTALIRNWLVKRPRARLPQQIRRLTPLRVASGWPAEASAPRARERVGGMVHEGTVVIPAGLLLSTGTCRQVRPELSSNVPLIAASAEQLSIAGVRCFSDRPQRRGSGHQGRTCASCRTSNGTRHTRHWPGLVRTCCS
jgi:hypothetical protein